MEIENRLIKFASTFRKKKRLKTEQDRKKNTKLRMKTTLYSLPVYIIYY